MTIYKNSFPPFSKVTAFASWVRACKMAHRNQANMCYRYKGDIDQMYLKFRSKRKSKTNYVEQEINGLRCMKFRILDHGNDSYKHVNVIVLRKLVTSFRSVLGELPFAKILCTCTSINIPLGIFMPINTPLEIFIKVHV